MTLLSGNSTLLRWYAAGGVLGGLILALLLWQSGLSASLSQATLFALPLSVLLASSLPSAAYLSRAMQASRDQPARIALNYLSAAALVASALTLLAEAWNSLLPDGLVQLTLADNIALWLLAAMLYLLALLLADALQAVSRASRAEQLAAEARLHAREAELAMLRLQINPHFLFNSLNAISALTAFDAAAAREMTLTLATFYRHTLQLAGLERITLAQELTLCRHYLAIEHYRFGERLQFAEQLAANPEDIRLPPMLLQPLLENAIKHGLQAGNDGEIRLQIASAHGWLYLLLDNPATHAGTSGTGTGIANVRARLAASYGERALLTAGKTGERFAVEIRLPVET